MDGLPLKPLFIDDLPINFPINPSIKKADFPASITGHLDDPGSPVKSLGPRHPDQTCFLAGWWYTYPCEKYDTPSGMMKFPIYGKDKNCSKPTTS